MEDFTQYTGFTSMRTGAGEKIYPWHHSDWRLDAWYPLINIFEHGNNITDVQSQLEQATPFNCSY